jgi:ABC-type transport system substrate-binding protein
VPPGSFTWDPDHEAPYYRYDPEEARRLVVEAKRLHEARFGTPLPTLTYTLRGNRATTQATGEFLRLCWQAVGIDVTVEPLDFAKWLDEKRAHNLQFWSGGWVADYPDEETFFQLSYSRNYDGGANGTGFSDAAFDALYERAAVLPDGEARRDLYRRMSHIIEDQVPTIVLYYDVRREMYFDWLGDLQLHVYLKAQPMYYRLDGALREARLSGRVEGRLEDLITRGAWPPGGASNP